MFIRKSTFIRVLAMAFAAPMLHAGIVAEALFSFPADTEYVEYDNLALLRTAPEYSKLRHKFSGNAAEEAASVLAQLGIPETEVREVVNASDAKASFGLLSGSFSSESLRKSASARRYASPLLDHQIFCAGRETCIVFLEDSLAAFGPPARLKAILQARRGTVTRFDSNPDAVRLLNANNHAAAVRGLLLGAQLRAGIAAFAPQSHGSNAVAPEVLSRITSVAYSVAFDQKAHVSATVECSSIRAASLLTQVLNVFANLGMSLPVKDIQVSNLANRVYLTGNADPGF